MRGNNNKPYSDELIRLMNRKSGLILRAMSERDRIDGDGTREAQRLFALAAGLEMQIISKLIEEGYKQRLYIPLVSAASCYKSAGRYVEALPIFYESLKQDGMPAGLRKEVKRYIKECEVMLQ